MKTAVGRERMQMYRDRVSIVTPVYNGESHLAGMLDSVLAQTWPNLEMILVDDGSSDGTIQVAEGYREAFSRKGIPYEIVKAPHKHASGAVNQGLPLVTGEYLIWPDSDDVLAPESVRKRVEFLKAHPEYECVRSLSWYFDASTGERREKGDEKRGDLSKEELFWDILESSTFVCCGCYMLRSERFFEIYPERRIPEYPVGQNFQMLLPFMYRHRCPTLREELYGVAVRQDSHSRARLTQEQEERKYLDYEHLIDDIVQICGMTDRKSLERIACWKAKRRYSISLKYGRKKQAVRALHTMRRCGNAGFGRVLKETIWICLVNGWVEDHIYPIYRKLFERTR